MPVSPYVFTTERRSPMTPAGFRKTLAAIAEAASFPFRIHPHMLRHAAGYKVVNDSEDTRSVQHYMGHKNIQHTVRYTELASDRFESFWKAEPREVTSIQPDRDLDILVTLSPKCEVDRDSETGMIVLDGLFKDAIHQ